MKRRNEEIDRVAEIDSALSWRLVNGKRKKSASAVCADINFNGHMASTPQKITDGWTEHFETLHSPSDDPRFFNEHKSRISRQLQISNENLAFSEPPTISKEEVEAAVRLGKKGKAAGDDGIPYEHIAFGGDIIFVLLANFLRPC